jgi:hypothetical protein
MRFTEINMPEIGEGMQNREEIRSSGAENEEDGEISDGFEIFDALIRIEKYASIVDDPLKRSDVDNEIFLLEIRG